jgi:hypothetical protein
VFSIVNEHIDGELSPLIPRFYDNFRSAKVEFIKNKSGKIIAHVLFPLFGIIVCAFILFSMSHLAKIVGFSWMGLGIIYLIIRSAISKDFHGLLEKNSIINPDATLEAS